MSDPGAVFIRSIAACKVDYIGETIREHPTSLSIVVCQTNPSLSRVSERKYMSYFAYACKTEGKNGISRLISELLRTLDSSLRDRLFVLQNEVF